MMFPLLHTNRCVLSQITDADVTVLWEIFNDNLFSKFLPELSEVFVSQESLKTFIGSFDNYFDDGSGILWGIRLSDKLVGFIAIMDIPDHATLFYAMHPEYRNMRLMSESIDKVINFWTLNYPQIPLNTEVYRANSASLAILQHHNSIQVMLKYYGCNLY